MWFHGFRHVKISIVAFWVIISHQINAIVSEETIAFIFRAEDPEAWCDTPLRSIYKIALRHNPEERNPNMKISK